MWITIFSYFMIIGRKKQGTQKNNGEFDNIKLMKKRSEKKDKTEEKQIKKPTKELKNLSVRSTLSSSMPRRLPRAEGVEKKTDTVFWRKKQKQFQVLRLFPRFPYSGQITAYPPHSTAFPRCSCCSTFQCPSVGGIRPL